MTCGIATCDQGALVVSDDEAPPSDDTTFDPSSPYAFQPPDYSLPKDPPKYCDIVAAGADNPGFVAAADQSSDAATSAAAADGATAPAICDNFIVASGANSSAVTSATTATGASRGRNIDTESPPPVYEITDSAPQLSQAAHARTDDAGAAARAQHNPTYESIADVSATQPAAAFSATQRQPSSSTSGDDLPPPYDAAPQPHHLTTPSRDAHTATA